MDERSKYEQRGVSATKDEVHAAIKHLDKGLYPLAFCKILPDLVGGDENFCNIMHADTAGTKTSLAYLHWKETGDKSIWRGVSQDAIVMNVDDMACVGCTDQIVLSSTIGRNKNLMPGEVIQELINGTTSFIESMQNQGVNIVLAGGETADVGDIVRTIDVGFTTFARLPKEKLIINDIQAGDVIVGLASYGQTTYETYYNSGIGSNGLTAARHDVLHKKYAQRYPDSYDPNTDDSVVFTGPHDLRDASGIRDLSIGDALLSPTRTYLPVLKAIFDAHHPNIHGVIHCTGGGQTKVSKFVQDKHIIKDDLFPTPPLFQLIQEASGTHWKEMFQVFNMGHRIELYVNRQMAEDIISLAESFSLDAKIVGRVEDHQGSKVTISHEGNVYTY
ncbi:MAG: phosphoribosylformylglycinamidine cyclo-ligase [Saprospiraceae bacterium]|nr:phosphoribosylformylglycinamidine cyclo-ligase [Saprospiraceae bacterium]